MATKATGLKVICHKCSEIFILQQESLLLMQLKFLLKLRHSRNFNKWTYSTYKNHNTYKCLIGISPGGAVTFISKLFPGSITDRQLTEKSGLLQLLERGDSVMADRGFDIQDDLTPIGVKVNIPLFLKGKQQLDAGEMVETRRIASLRIHVERAMERIKNFHIFDRVIPATLTDVAEQMFFVCAILTNFLPPLCS